MKVFALGSILTFLLTTMSILAAEPDPDFDRLDGKGLSGKKVDVIEWEGNLEVHVYPKGSLAGLAMKIDEKDGRKIMVIGYRFTNNPSKQLIRRAILGIDLRNDFKAYRDSSADDYDKVIVSNHDLDGASTLASYRLDSAPSELYPEGHPERGTADRKIAASGASKKRAPASKPYLPTAAQRPERKIGPEVGSPSVKEEKMPRSYYDDDGRIRHFNW